DRVQADVVREPKRSFEGSDRLVSSTGERYRLGEPERAREERSFVSPHAVLSQVPEHEIPVHQRPSYRADGPAEALARGIAVPEAARQEDARVELVGVGGPRVAAFALGPAPPLDEGADRTRGLDPSVDRLARDEPVL